MTGQHLLVSPPGRHPLILTLFLFSFIRIGGCSGGSGASSGGGSAEPAVPGNDNALPDDNGAANGNTVNDNVSANDNQSDNANSSAGQLPCITCHNSPMGERRAVVDSSGVGGHPLSDEQPANADCEVCHEMTQHQQGSVRLWENPNDHASVVVLDGDPSREPNEAEKLLVFCQACHRDSDHSVHAVSGDWKPACTACHDLHDPENANRSLVQASVHNRTLGEDKPVVFTARAGAGSFDDGDPAANDGICQVCHTATSYHRHDGTSAAHHDGENCTMCHLHAVGFIPVADASCTFCHGSAQAGRRPVMDEFSLASHHVQGAAVTDSDCGVCHEMRQHQQGQVRLKNVDDPDNPEATVSLSGDPMSDPAEAEKLEAFCLACHDTDGAGGAAPFSNGEMPPPIDAALWAAASHSVSPTTCVGDGETFGCHSTGHGSVKSSLLAPWDGSQSGVAGDAWREEEGLCYSCHDADGPASTDIQAQFALASRHDVSSLDQSGGSRVECTDCHNPHTAGEAASLVHPDSGEVWSGSGEAFCLTCHDGAPPAGVSFPATASGTGYDKSAFVGTTHDTQLGSDSCGHCHEAHGSSHVAMLKEQYIVADYNEYSAGDGDYGICWSCHDENTIIEQSNAFQSRHRRHVKDKDAPCIVCHDAHGGFDADEPGLINFAYSVNAGYDIAFIDDQDGSTSFWIDVQQDKGSCSISCHDKDHTPKQYRHTDASTTDCTLCHVVPPGN